MALTEAERRMVGDMGRAIDVAVGQFADAVARQDLAEGERWARMIFGIVEALDGEPEA